MIDVITGFFSNVLFDFVVPGIAIGSLSILISFFLPKVLSKYKIVLFVSGIMIVLFFVFQAGRMNVTNKYERQSLISRALIAELETKSAKVDTKIITEYVEKIKFVDRIKEVKTNVYVTQKDDSSCIISAGTSNNITIMLNSAGKGRLPGPANSTNDQSK